MDQKIDEQGIQLSEEQLKQRRGRSLALALALAGLVLLFYAVSFVKGPGILAKM